MHPTGVPTFKKIKIQIRHCDSIFNPLIVEALFLSWHPLKYTCIKSHISTFNQSAGIITNRTVNNLNVLMVLLCLESEPASDIIRLEKAQVSRIQFDQLSKLPLYDIFSCLIFVPMRTVQL